MTYCCILQSSSIRSSYIHFFKSSQGSNHDILRDAPTFSNFRAVSAPPGSRQPSNVGPTRPGARAATAHQASRSSSHDESRPSSAHRGGSRQSSSVSREYVYNATPAPIVSNMPSTPINDVDSSGYERPRSGIGMPSKINPIFDESHPAGQDGFVEEYRGIVLFQSFIFFLFSPMQALCQDDNGYRIFQGVTLFTLPLTIHARHRWKTKKTKHVTAIRDTFQAHYTQPDNTDSSHRALGEWTREIFDTTNCVPIKLPNFCSGI